MDSSFCVELLHRWLNEIYENSSSRRVSHVANSEGVRKAYARSSLQK